EINVELSHQLERTVHVRFVPGVGLHSRLDAPEQIRGECEVAVRRVAVCDRAHEPVDTEDFLDDDDSGAARRSWNGEIPTERPVGGVYRDLLAAHRTAPAKMRELTEKASSADWFHAWPCGRVGSCSTCESVTGLVIGAEQVMRWQT